MINFSGFEPDHFKFSVFGEPNGKLCYELSICVSFNCFDAYGDIEFCIHNAAFRGVPVEVTMERFPNGINKTVHYKCIAI